MYIWVSGKGGELTDGVGQVVSGQYHHGPVSPNIIWVLNCVFFRLHCTFRRKQTKSTESERWGKKADGVYLKEEDLKGGGKQKESE